MAINDEGGVNVSMPVQPMGYGNFGGSYGVPYAVPMGGYNNSLGGLGGDLGSLIVLFLFAMMFGGGFGGGFGGWGMGGFGGGFFDFPWLMNGQQQITNNTNDGFRDAQLHDSVTSVRDGVSNLATQLCGCCGDIQNGMNQGFAGVQQSLCNGFAGTTAAITGAQNAIATQLYNNEIANLNRSFAEQTANAQGFNGVNSGVADLRYTLATEACNNRTTSTQNAQSILTALNAGVQSIKDQLCQDKIDAKNDEIAQLRQEVLFARGQQSQDVQTATLRTAGATIANQAIQELRSCPIPTQPVYGNQPIFTCQPNYSGCGCGNNGFGFAG